MPFEFWLLGVAVVFTIFGYNVGIRKNVKNVVEIAISTTIDNLIQEGYLKTRGTGDELEILKINDKTDRN